MLHVLEEGDCELIARALMNDLEEPAYQLLPELLTLRERMFSLGCLGVLLCGSGSALFGLCPDEATAYHAALDLTNDCPWSWAGPWQMFR